MGAGSAMRFVPLTIVSAPEIRNMLFVWFSREGRSFPWRFVERAISRPETEPIHDPYEILVSEVMLQQTQTTRVIEKLPEFLRVFPTVESLADANRGELLRAWRGMGYNRRALRLQETARAIVDRHQGAFPATLEDLQALPGIGRYTASAILCFAFGVDVPVVDVNIIRVLSRLFYKCHTPEQLMPEQTVLRLAKSVVPVGDSYRWHQALMDLGAMICTARTPSCERCPLQHLCLSAFPADVDLFHTSHVAAPEPMFRGEPRRIWRGRIIETLRDEEGAVRLSDVLDRILPSGLFDHQHDERQELVSIARVLVDEGMIERVGGVFEGELQEHDRVALPGT